jgi:hypothetical protein
MPHLCNEVKFDGVIVESAKPMARVMPPEGFRPQIRAILTSTVATATVSIITRLLNSSPSRQEPPNYEQRDQRIRELYASGMTQAKIAAQFGISPRRVSYIVRKNH